MKLLKQKGLSLVELMVALVLSAIIIAGIFQVFMSNRVAFNMTESLIRSQENGRFTIDFMSSNIRQAGNYGCVPEFNPQVNNIISRTNLIDNFNAIQLANGGFPVPAGAPPGWGTTMNGVESADPAVWDQPDTLTLLQLEGTEAIITAAAGGTLTVAGGDDFDVGDFFLVSNCQVGDIFQATAGTNNAQVVDGTNQIRTSFYSIQNDVSTVSELRHISFMLDNEVLQVSINGGNTEDLVDGVENMQFRFGVDHDGDFVPDYFDDIEAVDNAGDIADIIAVEVNLITVSDNEVTTSPQTINYLGTDFEAPDNRLRKVYTSTITLRNRLN